MAWQVMMRFIGSQRMVYQTNELLWSFRSDDESDRTV
jgi:hypothetical protein